MMRESELYPINRGDTRPTLLRGVGEGLGLRVAHADASGWCCC